jgi:hypothetical protein
MQSPIPRKALDAAFHCAAEYIEQHGDKTDGVDHKQMKLLYQLFASVNKQDLEFVETELVESEHLEVVYKAVNAFNNSLEKSGHSSYMLRLAEPVAQAPVLPMWVSRDVTPPRRPASSSMKRGGRTGILPRTRVPNIQRGLPAYMVPAFHDTPPEVVRPSVRQPQPQTPPSEPRSPTGPRELLLPMFKPSPCSSEANSAYCV